jgi:cysteine-rich repeat protein
MRGKIIRGFGSILFVAALAGLVGGAFAPARLEAAPDPLKLSRKCRKVIGKSAAKLANTGLKQIDKCHKQRDKTNSETNCNDLDGNDVFGRERNAFAANVGVACKPDDPVRSNYPSGDIAASVVPSITAALEDSGVSVQGLPSFTGDPSQVKALSKCHGAIGQGRTKTVGLALKAINNCQKAGDKTADTFPPLGDCETAGDGAAGQGTAQVAKKCSGLELPVVTQGVTPGGIITSCSDPTTCVSEEAIQAARRIASSTYGGGCGNGFEEGGEECDDGNTDNDDGCSNQCTLPVCGDGARQGDEECDDGNLIDTDDCSATCKLPVCGDGVQAGDEQCDDGDDTVPGDGCTNCMVDPVACSSQGTIRFKTTLEFPEDLGVVVAGVRTSLTYPATLSIPSIAIGNGVSFVCSPNDPTSVCPEARVFPISPAFFGQAFSCAADPAEVGKCAATGTADSIFTNFATVDPNRIDPGELYEIVFDCEPGMEIDPATVPCAVFEAASPGPNPIELDGFRCNLEAIRPGAATGAP